MSQPQSLDTQQYLADSTRLFQDFIIAFEAGAMKQDVAEYKATVHSLRSTFNFFLWCNHSKEIPS